jgi:hypothetical protein
MMRLAQEVQNIQNPALGSALVWRFVCGYVSAHPTHDPAPLPLAFLVAPIVLHERTEEFVQSTYTSSGLRAFAGKFAKYEHSKQDLLIGINHRAIAMRQFTMESIRIGIATRLVQTIKASLVPLSQTPAKAGIPKDVRRLLASAEKIGAWLGPLTLHEVSTVLKVRF